MSRKAPPLVFDLPLVLAPFSERLLLGHASSFCRMKHLCIYMRDRLFVLVCPSFMHMNILTYFQ